MRSNVSRTIVELCVSASLISILTLTASGAGAQGTPEPGTVADPALCTGAARPVEDFLALSAEPPGALQQLTLGTPHAALATPEPIPADAGEPADQTVIDAISELVVHHNACVNAGDLRRDTARWTDDLVRSEFAGLSEAQVNELVTPAVLPKAAQARIPAIADVRVLPDGRVTAVLRTAEVTARAVFVEEGGHYLIDATYALPGAGTPTP